jgi:CheY-like chemotaxis protein
MTTGATTIHQPKPAQKAFRVLVVDDSQSDIDLTIAQLSQSWPFETDLAIELARDGREALTKLQRERFALLILDWQIPKTNGYDLLRHVRKSGSRVAIVVVTGLERDAIIEDLESHGAAYLHKDEMAPHTLHGAIATSLRLLGHLPAA